MPESKLVQAKRIDHYKHATVNIFFNLMGSKFPAWELTAGRENILQLNSLCCNRFYGLVWNGRK